MIKRILLPIVASVLFSISAYSQCTGDPNCAKLICPDTISNMDSAYSGLYYDFVFTMRVPADTLYGGNNVHVDSIVIGQIAGLPSSLSFNTNNLRKSIMGGTLGCFKISGIPVLSDTGTHTLTISTVIYGTVSGFNGQFPFNILGYKLKVGKSNSIREIPTNSISNIYNTPNPFSGKTEIHFSSQKTGDGKISVYNIVGKQVLAENINVKQGENSYEFIANGLTSGIYMYRLEFENQAVTKRMIIR